MKKRYTSPELEIVRFTLTDVILGSPTDLVSEQSQDNQGGNPNNNGDDLFNDITPSP